MEPGIDKSFLLQLLAQPGKQRLPIDRRIDHLEMGRIEIFIQHPRTGPVHQHQLADLIQLIIGRKWRNGHHRLVFFTNPHGRDDKIFSDRRQLFILPLRQGGGDF